MSSGVDRRPLALVTGGTRGIGLGIARALARDRWDLALCGVRAPSAVAGVIGELSAEGGRVRYFVADIARRDDRASLLAGVAAELGAVTALVNNAGRAPGVRADLLEATEESFDELVRTNLQAPYFLTQAVANAMLAEQATGARVRPTIVFVTSVSAELASVSRGDYCVSKAGLAMAARLFAARLAAHGIAVFDVRPGIIDTDMTARVKELYDRRIADGLVPELRWGHPHDVGRVVAALARGDLPYSTGSVIHVDGGLTVGRL